MNAYECAFVGLPSPTLARSGPGGHPCQGLYWTARRQPRPRVAAIATHFSVDFSEHYLAPWLTRHGIGFLGWNTRFRGADDQFLLEPALIDIGVGVRWLKEEAGADVIVILGNSGGGSLMSTYQAWAGDPSLACGASGETAAALANLRAGDLFIAVAAHTGRADVLTSWMDPSVTDEADPVAGDSSLDAFNPANGPPYPEEFIARYRAAQLERNRRITRWAKSRLASVRESGVPEPVFPIYRTWADLRFVDPDIDRSDRPTPRCYAGDPAVANRKLPGVARSSTLSTWLSMWSVDESRCRGTQHLRRIEVPSLVVQATRDVGVFPSDARALLDGLGAQDKQLQSLPGGHFFEGDGGDRERLAEALAQWVLARC
jgi:hypothetical protein